jgi:large subunit ribosomal protein L29
MLSTKEIREKQTEALTHELKDRQKHLFDLRSQAVTEKLEDPSQLKKTRKEIARIKTILRERDPKRRRRLSRAKRQELRKKSAAAKARETEKAST